MVQSLLQEGSWQLQYWNPSECTVVKLAGGGYGVLDHSIQTLVARGNTEQECLEWLCQG
jgi:hypothetical protein